VTWCGVTGENGNKTSPCNMHCSGETRGHADAATRDHGFQGDVARIDDDGSIGHDLDQAFAASEWPAERLPVALVSQVDGVVCGKLFRVLRCAPRCKIAWRGVGTQFHCHQPPRQQPRVCQFSDPYGNVDPFFDQVDMAIVHSEIESHLGIAFPEFRQHRRDHMHCDWQGCRNSQVSRWLGAGTDSHLPDLLCVAEQTQRPFMQLAPFRGQRERPRRAREQRDAQLLFQPPHALADRRRRDPQGARRRGIAAQRTGARESDKAG